MGNATGVTEVDIKRIAWIAREIRLHARRNYLRDKRNRIRAGTGGTSGTVCHIGDFGKKSGNNSGII